MESDMTGIIDRKALVIAANAAGATLLPDNDQ